jgi:threonine/homoserine/homoserine lactone efflux protein
MMNAEFLIISLIVVLVPGTGVIYTISTGLLRGSRQGIAAAIGCTLGIVPHLTASILGLATILHLSSVAFQILKFMGAGYLLYLAWTMWKENGSISFDGPARKRSYSYVVIRGVLINIFNPKLSIFFLAFLPQFIPVDAAAPLLSMIFLALVFMVMTLVVFIVYGIAASRVRDSVVNSPGLISKFQKSFAAIFAFLGVKLALTTP